MEVDKWLEDLRLRGSRLPHDLGVSQPGSSHVFTYSGYPTRLDDSLIKRIAFGSVGDPHHVDADPRHVDADPRHAILLITLRRIRILIFI